MNLFIIYAYYIKNSCSMKRGLFSNDGNPKKFITLNVERKIGAVIRERPDKKSKRYFCHNQLCFDFVIVFIFVYLNSVKTLLRDTKTYCYGRMTGPGLNVTALGPA